MYPSIPSKKATFHRWRIFCRLNLLLFPCRHVGKVGKEGKVKKPSEAAVKAAIDHIDHFLEEKKCPKKTAAAREMDGVTRELIERDEIEELIRNNSYKNYF